MARAENYFNRPDYPTALTEYEKVLEYRDKPDLVGLALFKSAWCHWRLGNTDEATKRFIKVVFEVTDHRRSSGGERLAAEGARRAPGRGAPSTSSRSSRR